MKVLITCAVLPVLTSLVFAQVHERLKLRALDGASGDLLGRSIAISGETVVCGAYADQDQGLYTGSVYVFENANGEWSQRAKLSSSEANAFDRFGWSVSVSGNWLIAGSPTDDLVNASCGTATIFQRSGGVWMERARLVASDPDLDDQFGYSVDLAGSDAVVGAHRDDQGGFNAGAAYVFRRSNGSWQQRAKLMSADAEGGDSFGCAVAIDGDTVVVGAYGDDSFAPDSGAAYVFQRIAGVWVQQAKLLPSEGQADGAFGFAVDIDEDTIVVGAYGTGTPVLSGRAYIFRRVGAQWLLTQRIQAPVPGWDDRFGFSVAVSGDLILVGSYLDDTSAPHAGAVHTFQDSQQGWSYVATLRASDASANDLFGNACAIDGDLAVVGAPRKDLAGTDQGIAYVFAAVDFRDCNGNGVADAIDIANGASPDSNSNGIPDDCEGPGPCIGDVSNDGLVTTMDLVLLLSNLGCISTPLDPCLGDLDGDGMVDSDDLNLLLANFSCGA